MTVNSAGCCAKIEAAKKEEIGEANRFMARIISTALEGLQVPEGTNLEAMQQSLTVLGC